MSQMLKTQPKSTIKKSLKVRNAKTLKVRNAKTQIITVDYDKRGNQRHPRRYIIKYEMKDHLRSTIHPSELQKISELIQKSPVIYFKIVKSSEQSYKNEIKLFQELNTAMKDDVVHCLGQQILSIENKESDCEMQLFFKNDCVCIPDATFGVNLEPIHRMKSGLRLFALQGDPKYKTMTEHLSGLVKCDCLPVELWEETCKIIGNTLNTLLFYYQTYGFVHGDLYSDNILVNTHNLKIRLFDFDFAFSRNVPENMSSLFDFYKCFQDLSPNDIFRYGFLFDSARLIISCYLMFNKNFPILYGSYINMIKTFLNKSIDWTHWTKWMTEFMRAFLKKDKGSFSFDMTKHFDKDKKHLFFMFSSSKYTCEYIC